MAGSPTTPARDGIGSLLLALVDLEETRRSASNHEARLADELAYDRALVNVSRRVGIDTGPERFDVPDRERARLHRALAEAMPALQEARIVARFPRGS